MKDSLNARLKLLKKRLSEEAQSSALLLSSAAESMRSRDQYYAFRQNSNFYYLTQSLLRNALLLVRSDQKRPYLFVAKIAKSSKLWDGPSPKPAQLARKLDAELIVSNDPGVEVLKHLHNLEKLYFDNVPSTLAWRVSERLLSLPAHRRGNLPRSFVHVDQILAPLRLIKDAQELKAIRHAARITTEALHALIPNIKAGMSEQQIAANLDYHFSSQGAQPAFSTIIAAGANATTLHHRPTPTLLKEGELLLIDCGAEKDLYCADISRTLPINGVFNEKQAALYEIVLRAQKAAIKKARPGIKLGALQQSASQVLLDGLLRMRLLRGSLGKLKQRNEILKYFPHGIGHPLGLDVHDIHLATPSSELVLKQGMLITIEPGLYFPKGLKNIPALGIRIEDDILITKKGAEILTSGFPNELSELEALMR